MKLLILILAAAANAEDRKWVWGEGKARTSDNRNIRYSVHEYPNEYDGSIATPEQFRPQYPGPYGPNSRPILPADNTQVLVGPDGPTGIIGRPGHKPARPVAGAYPPPVLPGTNVDPILAGPVPSWIREDPRYHEYDTCKCSLGFNCPGLKFGSCAKGKQYCCYNARDQHGPAPGYQNAHGDYPNKYYPGNFPFKPFNAIPSEYYEHGDYYDGSYNQPQKGNYHNEGYGRPVGNPNRPYYGNGQLNNGNYHQGPYGPSYGANNPYVGPYAPNYSGNYNGFYPGGFNWEKPYGRPYGIDNYARSATGKNGSTENTLSKTSTDGKL